MEWNSKTTSAGFNSSSGDSSTTNHSFGSITQPKSGFGTSTSVGFGGFGSTTSTTSSGGFGSSTNTSGFGGFGATTSFGSAQLPTKSGFTVPSTTTSGGTTSFESTVSSTTTSGGFGSSTTSQAGFGGFGSTTSTTGSGGFGSTTSSGFGGFGSSTNTSSGFGGFGSTTGSGGFGGFGSTTQNPSSFGGFNTAATTAKPGAFGSLFGPSTKSLEYRAFADPPLGSGFEFKPGPPKDNQTGSSKLSGWNKPSDDDIKIICQKECNQGEQVTYYFSKSVLIRNSKVLEEAFSGNVESIQSIRFIEVKDDEIIFRLPYHIVNSLLQAICEIKIDGLTIGDMKILLKITNKLHLNTLQLLNESLIEMLDASNFLPVCMWYFEEFGCALNVPSFASLLGQKTQDIINKKLYLEWSEKFVTTVIIPVFTYFSPFGTGFSDQDRTIICRYISSQCSIHTNEDGTHSMDSSNLSKLRHYLALIRNCAFINFHVDKTSVGFIRNFLDLLEDQEVCPDSILLKLYGQLLC